jgi:hypothetical protein
MAMPYFQLLPVDDEALAPQDAALGVTAGNGNGKPETTIWSADIARATPSDGWSRATPSDG